MTPRVESTALGLVLSLVVASSLLSGCSLLIGVDPDCSEVSDCSPYVCNADNTACLASCVNDLECGDGFVCEAGGGECISQGCVASGPVTGLLSLTGAGFEYDVARLGDSFYVIAASSQGVGLLDVASNGQVVGGADAFVVLDRDPTPPVVPVAAANDDGISFVWRGTLDSNLFDLRAFHLGADGESVGPGVIYAGRRGQNLDTPDAAYFGDELVVVWSTFLDRVQVELLPLNGDTTYGPDSEATAPNEAAVVVSDPGTGSSLPAVTATAERPVVARRDTTGGSNAVIVSFLDSTYQAINDHDVSGTTGIGIQRVQIAGMTNAVAVAWTETIDGRATLLRAVDNDNGTVLAGTPSQDLTMDLQDAALAAGSTEFALAWVADDLDGVAGRDVFVRRFDATGQPLFVTFSVTGRAATDAARPRLVRTPDGYAVFWIAAANSAPELSYRRFVCAR